MRTYHSLYKPARTKNPRRKMLPKSKLPAGKIVRRRRNRRKNPGLEPESEKQIRNKVAKEMGAGMKGSSSILATKMFSPAATLMMKPGEAVEYQGQLWEADAKDWTWVNFDNVGTAFDTGKEKDLDKASKEAASSLVNWGGPALARAVELATEGKKGKASTEAAAKAITGFKLATFTPSGKRLPAAGKSADFKIDGQRKAKVYAKKPPKSWNSGLEVIYYVEVLDDDGKAIGGGKIGPLGDGASVENTIASMDGLLKGNDDAIEANPVQRARMESKTRRYFAKPNGIISGSRNFEVSGDRLQATELKPMGQIVGIPQGDPNAAFDFGYNMGLLRGINTCRLYPDLAGAWERRKLRKQLEKGIVEASQELSNAVMSGRRDMNRVSRVRGR